MAKKNSFINIFENNTGMKTFGDFVMITLVLHFFIYLVGYLFRKKEWTKENMRPIVIKLESIYAGIIAVFFLTKLF